MEDGQEFHIFEEKPLVLTTKEKEEFGYRTHDTKFIGILITLADGTTRLIKNEEDI